MMKRYLIFCVLVCVVLLGCTNGSDNKNGENKQSQARVQVTPGSQNEQAKSARETHGRALDDDTVLARLPSGSVMQSQLDESIALRIYDLEWSKYELRRRALSVLIEESKLSTDTVAGGGSPIKVLIEPPMPPRVVLPSGDSQPGIGSQLAPVTVSVFCNYQSSHCARMLRVYESLLQRYEQNVRLEFYDFPLAYHREAVPAAQAARCANKFGEFWPYHKGLYAQYDQLSSALYARLATQVNIDNEDFSRCMDEGSFNAEVEGNKQLASRLDLDKVPITLINGLYLSGPRSFDTLRFFVDKELTRIADTSLDSSSKKVSSARPEFNRLVHTALPIRLEGVLLGSPASNSIATISGMQGENSERYRVGDEVLPGVTLVQVEMGAVVIDNSGTLERLRLSAGSDDAESQSGGSESILSSYSPSLQAPRDTERGGANRSLIEPEDVPAGLEYSYRGVVDAVGETPLSKQWIEEHLGNVEQLRSHFAPTELEVEGVRVLRLDAVEGNEFYQTLGLKEKDVILRVNDEWVHEAQNNLFDKLAQSSEVSIVLMRKGLPVHLKYAIN